MLVLETHILTISCCFLLLQTERQLDCALDLMRRLPPQQIEKNLSDLIDLVSSTFCNLLLCTGENVVCVFQVLYLVMEFIKD